MTGKREKKETSLFEVSGLKKYFKTGRKGIARAVDDVSFSIRKGETLGLVGESGCGKTTCGRTGIGLYRRTAGRILYRGREIDELKGREKKEYSRRVQMIFQDPYTSLDPRMKVGKSIAEGLRLHGLVSGAGEERERVEELLGRVGLHPDFAHRLPGEFSGGQRQRIGIARALAVEPEFLLCDEPTSALDVSVQAQIISLLESLQEEQGLTYLFISHNLAAVRYLSDQVAVMYLGRIVEMGKTSEVFDHPLHPYTKALLSAVPIPDPDVERGRSKIILTGETGEKESGVGCGFAPRCPYATKRCREEVPRMPDFPGSHGTACWLEEKS